MVLPNIEAVAEKVHESWIEQKLSQGITTRLASDGEELMVPYNELSETARDLDRTTVKAVYDAIDTL